MHRGLNYSTSDFGLLLAFKAEFRDSFVKYSPDIHHLTNSTNVI